MCVSFKVATCIPTLHAVCMFSGVAVCMPFSPFLSFQQGFIIKTGKGSMSLFALWLVSLLKKALLF